MRKIILVFILIFVQIGTIQAQNRVDEFISLGLPEDKLLDTLINVSFSLIRNNPQEALELSLEANRLAIKIKDDNLEVKTYYYIANSYFYLEDFEKSINTFYKGIDIAKKKNQEFFLGILYNKLGWTFYTLNNYKTAYKYFVEGLKYADSTILPHIYHDIAANYQVQGSYDSCIYYYMKAYDITSKSNDISLQLSILNNLGTLYISTNDFEKGKNYIKKSVEVYEESNNIQGYIASLNNLGVAYKKLGNIDSAVYCYNQSLILSNKKNITSGINNALVNLGNLEIELGKFNEAELKLKKALLLSEKLDDSYIITECLIGFSELNVGRNKKESAIKYLLQALKIAKDKNHSEQELFVLEKLAFLYDEINNYDKSSMYYKEYFMIKDSLFSIEKAEYVENLKIGYEVEQKDQEIQILEKEKQVYEFQQKILFLGAIIAILLVSLLIYIFSLRNRNSKQKIKIFEEEKKARVLELEKKELKFEKEKLKNENLTIEISSKQRELTTKALNLVQNNEFNIIIAEKLNSLTTEFRDEKLNKTIKSIINQIIIKNKNSIWEEFEIHFQLVHKDFYSKLLKTHPDLTPNEIKLCAFLKLNLSSKEISTITQQTYNSIRIARSRLRKKIGIIDDKNMIGYLIGI